MEQLANACTSSSHTASASAGSSNTEPLVRKRTKHSTSPEPISSDDDDDFILPRRFKHKNTHEANAVKAKRVSKNSPTIPAKNEKKKKRKRNRSPTIWCAPEFIKSTIEILEDCQKKRIKELGFGWVLSLSVDALRTRNLPMFLMDNTSESLVINVGTQGGLKITPHAVHCVLGLPNGGIDPPPFSCAQKTEELLKLKKLLRVPKHKDITFEVLYERISLGNDDDLTIRCFIIIVFNRLLFPTTGTYITGRDAAWTSDLDNLPNIDWCKVLVDDIRRAVISWKSKKLSYSKKLANPKTCSEPTLSLTSCTLFCIIFYLDNLFSINRLDAIEIPRIAHFTNDTITNILDEDSQKANGLETYGKLALRPKESTCYFEDYQSQLLTVCPPSLLPTVRVLTNYLDNRASVHDGSCGDPNVSNEVSANYDHLSPSRQPSQTVEISETGAEMMEEANFDVRHRTNATILPDKNQAQPPSPPPTVDSSRDDLDNCASVHDGSCGCTALAQLYEGVEFDGTGCSNKTPIAAHGDIHTRQGSMFMTAHAARTHYLSLEKERRKSPRDGEQLRYNGPSSEPQPAHTTEGMQVASDTSMVRNRGSPLTMEKGGQSAKKARVQQARVETSVLNCRICFRPLKPPVFQCNGGHLACGPCLAELPGGQCPTCKHGGGFVPCLAVDGIVSSATIKCSHDGCQRYVSYHEIDDHHRACPHSPCFCTEPGCGFAGPPPALLGHLATLHSWPVHKIEYDKVLGLQVPVSEPRHLLLAEEDGRVFLLVVGELNAITAVSVVCIRASMTPWLQYPAVMWAYGPPAVAGVRCMVDTEAVTSSTRPGDVAVEKLPFVLLVPPTHVFGAGASKEVSLEIRINKM